MDLQKGLTRFLDAQNQDYLKALAEMKAGKKISHWIWYIFPQLRGLGFSDISKFYGINGPEEAVAYITHPVLGRHLIDITTELLQTQGKTATDIFGAPDDMKFRSCMTLFANVPNANPVFEAALDKYFIGLQDELTLQLLLREKWTAHQGE